MVISRRTRTEAPDTALEPETASAERLVLFTDAVTAIAITLLVLPLVEVFGEPGISGEPVGSVLGEHVGAFGALLLGFVLVSRLWWAHHQLLRTVERVDGGLARLNFVWIFAVVLLPVTTQVITAWSPRPATVALYGGALVLAVGAVAAMALHLDRHPGLLRPGHDVRPQLVGSLVTAGLLVLAVVVGSVFAGAVNFFAYLLLLLSGPVERVVARRWPRPSSS